VKKFSVGADATTRPCIKNWREAETAKISALGALTRKEALARAFTAQHYFYARATVLLRSRRRLAGGWRI
jgi:hypothetical protein